MPLECNAVFKGGGAKGIAYVGALEALERWDATCVEVAGSSAGAITATLVACGYSAAEIIQLMPDALAQIDSVAPSMAMFGVRSSVLSNEGLHHWLKGAIAKKLVPDHDEKDPPECTFRQIADRTIEDAAGDEMHVGVDLYVITLDLSTRQPLVFCPQLTPDSPVAAAVVASSAIPVAFPPARMSVNGETHRLVDGGTWSNYPSFVFLDKDFRDWAGLPETNRTTIGFILDPPASDDAHESGEEQDDEPADQLGVVAPAPPESPTPVRGAPLITDHGSSTAELDLSGAVISSMLFRGAIALAPLLFVLLSLFWVTSEFTGANPVIGRLPHELQDVVMIMAFAVLAVTGVAAVVLAVVVLRLGRSLFDTGVMGATAAMGVGPGVPEWVGNRSERVSAVAVESADHVPDDVTDDVPDHVAVRIKVPEALSTLAFRATEETREAARLRGRADTERELERVFGPPTHAASTDLEAIMAPERLKIEPPRQSGVRRALMLSLAPLAWLFEAVAKVAGRVLSWTAGKSIPRFAALAYALVAGTSAAVNVMVGLGGGGTWMSLVWIVVVMTAAVAAIWLVASMRSAEARNKTQYRYLRRLRRWPLALVALSAMAFASAVVMTWSQLSFNDVSLFTAVRAEPLVGEVEYTSEDGDGVYAVLVGVPLLEQDEDAFFAFLDAADPLDSDTPVDLVDLVGAPVEYLVVPDDIFDEDAIAFFEMISVNRVEPGDEVTVRVDAEQSLAYLEGDLDDDLGAKIQLQAVMIIGFVLLSVAFRSMRVARWASQQKKNAMG